MPDKKNEKVSDFRYDTGEARVPWAAVGEHVREDDILALVKFLLRPARGEQKQYDARLNKVAAELRNLGAVSTPAGKLSLAGNVQALEEATARFLGAKHTVFLTNATAGFEIAFKYANLKPGDEVIAPAITFIATIAYPLALGAKVVLSDVDPRSLNMDPEDVARKITPRTKAIIPVHLGGYPVDMAPIMKLARKHDITVIEDAAHAFGASYRGKMIGTIGHFGSFSFHEVKNITSLGEGGILASTTAFGKELRRARFLGLDLTRQIPNWLYDVPAFEGKDGCFFTGNYSTTEIQALGLLSQMKRLPRIIARRKKAAQYLDKRFSKIDGLLTPPGDDARIKSTYHLYLLQIDPDKVGGDIQTLKKKLDARGIVQIPHFAPLYKFSVMKQLGYDTAAIEKTCPVAEEAFQHRFTHLPLYDFTREQLAYLADAVIEAVGEMKRGV
ncbi:MAG TPA: DegT/DnrJ/EryC1/StrS family aminotransferase [Candidatus Hydrogenedentes bacterium]|jgi:dTDP-4-amino-4,6-dideoxygalactose transaminase|nr:DegT/DnrJ/EryC1/StrS family aminotransferase [Candidatus Hydrogenedentota bacterium]HPV36393.1 DegT/DnrJ/EryC1/StrS family aminotransferase [Candidatus Hydrogenedentota bacterium]HQH67943.1 DegT/DnrJ/EryC1/StrS family aminotransferase [Candidatus Hydrogenedentota bacterium]